MLSQIVDPINGTSNNSGCRGGFEDPRELVYVPDLGSDVPLDFEAEQMRDEQREQEAKLARVKELFRQLVPHVAKSPDVIAAGVLLVDLAQLAGLDRITAQELFANTAYTEHLAWMASKRSTTAA